MELAGEEKKLQALFSELKAADEETTPRFAAVWNRAQPKARRNRAFSPVFVAAMALLICALVSLAVRSKYSQRRESQPSLAIAPARPTIESAPAVVAVTAPAHKIVPPVKRRDESRDLVAKRIAARHQAQLVAANLKVKQDAKTIANWQSPTTALLSSPSAEIFGALPQLNQSASDLKSFLPTRPN
jgi:hypothetical protein